jgi:hypothetical protein
MNCPKCGAVAATGAEECAACGIIFSRWREIPLRPSLSSTPIPAPEPQRIPLPFIIAGAILFVLIGIMWTTHRHSASAQKNDLDATLDEINNKGAAERERLRNESWKASVAAAHDRAVAAKAAAGQARALPPTITEADVRRLVEQEMLFQDNVTVSVPKVFEASNYSNVGKQYPAIQLAKNEALIEFDPPFEPGTRTVEGVVQVKVPPAAFYKAMIRDRGDTWEIDVGKRKIDALTVLTADDFKLDMTFTFTYEQAVGNALHPDGNSQRGEAKLTRGPDGWHVDSVTRQ